MLTHEGKDMGYAEWKCAGGLWSVKARLRLQAELVIQWNLGNNSAIQPDCLREAGNK